MCVCVCDYSTKLVMHVVRQSTSACWDEVMMYPHLTLVCCTMATFGLCAVAHTCLPQLTSVSPLGLQSRICEGDEADVCVFLIV